MSVQPWVCQVLSSWSHLVPFHLCVTLGCWSMFEKNCIWCVAWSFFILRSINVLPTVFHWLPSHMYFAGSLVLVGGDPGVGKSSLMLQVNVQSGCPLSILYAFSCIFNPLVSLHSVFYLYFWNVKIYLLSYLHFVYWNFEISVFFTLESESILLCSLLLLYPTVPRTMSHLLLYMCLVRRLVVTMSNLYHCNFLTGLCSCWQNLHGLIYPYDTLRRLLCLIF
jgi:hypothetical protein